MKHILENLFLLASLLALPNLVFAAPAVSSVNGTLIHGSSITISGSGFGAKSQAAPAVWDNASATNLATHWDGWWPNTGTAAYQVHYTTPINGVALPHPHVSQYIAGAHGDSAGSNDGYNVMIWKDIPTITYPTIIYMSSYWQIDPRWNSSLGSPQDNNFKLFDYSNGSSPYTMQTTGTNCNSNWYLCYAAGTMFTASMSPEWIFNDDGGINSCSLDSPDSNGHTLWWNGGANALGHWIKTEYEIRIARDSTGYIRIWDNGTLVLNYAGPTDGMTGATKSIALGGYARAYGASTQFRYFSDIYFDTTPQRAVICAGSTWANRGLCEVQVPSAWSDSSITVKVNQASFADASSKYLYVVDASGNASAGKQITFGSSGGGGGDTTPPAAPTGLHVK